jgi:hypothetical protein
MRRWGVFWGIVLVVVGALLLADQLGLLPVPVGTVIGPLLLVLLGVWIISGASGRRRRDMLPAEAVSVPLSGARAARVVIRHGAGRLSLAGGAAAGMLVEGSAAGGIAHRETRSADAVTTELEPSREWTQWSGFPAGGLEWDLRLSEEVPLALQLHVGASENRLDLTRLRLTEFELETGASSTEVRLPAAGGTRVRVESGAASVRMTVPPDVPTRIVSRSGLASIVVAPRFAPLGDSVWETPGYASSAADRVEIDVRAGVGEVRVD